MSMLQSHLASSPEADLLITQLFEKEVNEVQRLTLVLGLKGILSSE